MPTRHCLGWETVRLDDVKLLAANASLAQDILV